MALNLQTGDEDTSCLCGYLIGFSDGFITSDSLILYNLGYTILKDNHKFYNFYDSICTLDTIAQFNNVMMNDEGFTGLTGDINNIIYSVEASFIDSFSIIRTYNLETSKQNSIDTFPFLFQNDFTFVNGYFFSLVKNFDYSDPHFIFYDIFKRKIVKSIYGFSDFERYTNNLASIATPCKTLNVFFVRHDSLYKLNLNSKTSTRLFPASAFSTPVGSTTSEYLASMPEVKIDSVKVNNADCGLNNGSIILYHRFMYGRSIVYRLNHGVAQSDSIFTGLAPGKYVVTMTDTTWGCSFTSDTIIVENNASFPPITIEKKDDSCGKDNGRIIIRNLPDSALVKFQSGTYNKDSVFPMLPAGNYTLYFKTRDGCKDTVNITIDMLPPPSLNYGITPDHCMLGTGSLSITGKNGIEPLSWKLNSGSYTQDSLFQQLQGGTYMLSIRDSLGCIVTDTIFIPSTSPPTITGIHSFPTHCGMQDGAVLILTSSLYPLQYKIDNHNWQDTSFLTGLTAGQHLLTIRDSLGCMVTDTFTLSSAPHPAILSIDTSSAHCGMQDGSITIHAAGLTSLEYRINSSNWLSDSTFLHLSAGVYTLSVRDSFNCITSDTLILSPVDGPHIMEIKVKDATCDKNNGAITIFMENGSENPQYRLNSGTFQAGNRFTGLAPGEYLITVRDQSGCLTQQMVEIVQEGSPEIVNIQESTADCKTGKAKLNFAIQGGTPPFTISLNGETTSSPPYFLETGTYHIAIEDKNACKTDTTFILDGKILPKYEYEITQPECGEELGVFTLGTIDTSLTYILNGRTIDKSELSRLPAGTYFLTIPGDSSRCEWNLTFVIQKPDCKVYIPNAFSPNDDGLNDKFAPLAATDFRYSIKIYGRWGAIIYACEGTDCAWDGKNSLGKRFQPGVYFYRIEYNMNGAQKIKTGTVSLLR